MTGLAFEDDFLGAVLFRILWRPESLQTNARILKLPSELNSLLRKISLQLVVFVRLLVVGYLCRVQVGRIL